MPKKRVKNSYPVLYIFKIVVKLRYFIYYIEIRLRKYFDLFKSIFDGDLAIKM